MNNKDIENDSNNGEQQQQQTTTTSGTIPTIYSLDEFSVHLEPCIRKYLEDQYNNNGTNNNDDHLQNIIDAMKRPPSSTVCRVNLIKANRRQVQNELSSSSSSSSSSSNPPSDSNRYKIQEHPIFSNDVITITPSAKSKTTRSLSSCRVPFTENASSSPSSPSLLFTNWPIRQKQGWPMTHRVVLVDHFCGEAVLRGSDIFVRGVLAADMNIKSGDVVAIYTNVPNNNSNNTKKKNKILRGMTVERYDGTCIFLGLGEAKCNRNEMFKNNHGVAVSMSADADDRVGPLLPPLNRVLEDKMMLQNLPSIVVGHVLNPQPHDTILDMCCAPGGKTAHLASLVQNQAEVIVACDKSTKKILAAKGMFTKLGATCIVPIALDTTDCVDSQPEERKSVVEVGCVNGDKQKKCHTCTLIFLFYWHLFFSSFLMFFFSLQNCPIRLFGNRQLT
jgi:16S rRNA C967 or C1407 C5-methylase (RsmB/RsmF family)